MADVLAAYKVRGQETVATVESHAWSENALTQQAESRFLNAVGDSGTQQSNAIVTDSVGAVSH